MKHFSRNLIVLCNFSLCIVVVETLRGNYPCPTGKHYFTNCTDPCHFSEDTVVCKSEPTAKCQPDYCGGCIARFHDKNDKEIHCETEDGVICEMMTHSFQCDKGETLHLKSANYGRTSKSTCLHPFGVDRLHNSTDCRSPNAMPVVHGMCHGKQMCTIKVENEMFGPDPCYGIYKYLEVELECLKAGKVSSKGESFHYITNKILVYILTFLINTILFT